MLEIKNITVQVDGKEVIKNLSLTIKRGEIHALMGPNGSGKTSLCFALLGHPDYKITKGTILFNKKPIKSLKTEDRAKLGMFLSFQEPPELHGVGISSFLKTISTKHGQDRLASEKAIEKLNLPLSFKSRYLNDGFSGGEKKKSEMTQLAAIHPKMAILDEIDSGLDIDSLRTIATMLKKEVSRGMGLLFISHTTKVFKALKPNRLHILTKNGVISGSASLLKELEKKGYKHLLKKNA